VPEEGRCGLAAWLLLGSHKAAVKYTPGFQLSQVLTWAGGCVLWKTDLMPGKLLLAFSWCCIILSPEGHLSVLTIWRLGFPQSKQIKPMLPPLPLEVTLCYSGVFYTDEP
jgi:hypothetical protein